MKPMLKKNKKIKNCPHNYRKETNIQKVQKTLAKIKSPKGNRLEARPKSMDEMMEFVLIKFLNGISF